MSSLLIRAALETALASMSPALGTAYENADYTPAVGTPYQRAYVLFSTPDDTEVTGHLFVEQGYMQVNLFYPLGAGPRDAFTRAELIRSTFYRGSSFTSGGVTVTIRRTPEIYPAQADEDRFMVPVRVPFSAFITRS